MCLSRIHDRTATCVTVSASSPSKHVAVRSWMRDKHTLTSDEPGYVPSKNDWVIDIPGEPSSSWRRLDGWAEFNQTTFEARSIYVFLVFMMVSYVFLVSTAVQPLICFEDADGRSYLTADPTVNCEPCHFDDDIPKWLGGYEGLVVLSWFSLVVYGLAIPSYFFYIVHTHREEVKSGPYLQKYGFLTAKFSERFYGANATIAMPFMQNHSFSQDTLRTHNKTGEFVEQAGRSRCCSAKRH